MRRLLTCLAACVSLGLVTPAIVADGHQANRFGPVQQAALPAMTVEQLPARSAEGRFLGTMVVPALLDPAGDAQRPLLLVFNGGPGAASGWLQLGLLGPWRAAVPDDPAKPLGGRLALVPNREGLWDRADMLFVDPLGTGFSRAAPGVATSEIRDWRKDGDYIAGAVREWMVRHRRERSPVVLMGESYGAERAVAVADALIRGPAPARIAGMVLVSQTVTTDLSLAHRDRALANAVALPTIAATACYLGKSGLPDRDPAVCAEQAQTFAMRDYRQALSAGTALPQLSRSAAIGQLARLTGLPQAIFATAGLTVDRNAYRRQALASAGLVLGMYDSRYSAPIDRAKGWQDPSFDPLLPAMQDAAVNYGQAVLGLARSPLDGSPYILFNPELHANWRYGAHADPYGTIDIAGVLAKVLHRSGAHLLVAGGMFDTVGSYGGDRYLVAQARLPTERVTLKSYPAGHMFYLDGASRRKFLPTLRDFLVKATSAATHRPVGRPNEA